MDATVQTRHLTKTFGSNKGLIDLTLDIPKGAIFALLGDNGAGKSTTIRLLTGQFQPDSGSATVLGLDCWHSAYSLRHRVGYVPEKPRFYDWMTPSELGAFAAGFHHDGYRGRYMMALKRFSVDPKARLKTLSKGGYAKVGLALALALDPEVLILDEPTSGLDLFTRREFVDSMIDLASEGRTILISSHAIAELEKAASHVAFLAKGKLLLSGDLEGVRERFVAVRIRHDGSLPETTTLGEILEQSSSGREWRGTILDPKRSSLDELAAWPGVLECEESPLSLEEMYTALLAQYHRPEEPANEKRQPTKTLSGKGDVR
jgi:ABC-2 type transport system ATP-binding protein